MEALVKSCNICWVWSGMLNLLENKKAPISPGRVELFLSHVVTHLWKLQHNHAVLVGYGPACPKFSEITNHQYL